MSVSSGRNKAVLLPNLGVYLDRSRLTLGDRMLSDCRNVRIKNGKIIRENAGFSKFMTRNIVDPVTMIEDFFLSDGSQILMFATTKNLYQYDTGTLDVSFINPSYVVGTVSVTNGSAVVAGSGTTWTTNLKVGDSVSVGSNTEVDLDATWYEILTIDSDIQVTLTVNYAEATASGQNYTGRKTFTGDSRNYWSTDVFYNAQPSGDDHWYGVNGVDEIIRWNGSDTFATDIGSTLNFKCKFLRVYSDILVCADITEGGEIKPVSIKTSDLNNPENFTGGVSGEFVTQDGTSPINAMNKIGDSLAVYSRGAIVLMQFIGGDLTFAFREVISGIGPISGRAITDFGDFHEFLGPDVQYRFDGISISEINSHVWKEVLRLHAPNRVDLIIAHVDEENGEVYWVIPLNTDPGSSTTGQAITAYSQNYLEDVGGRNPDPFTIRDLACTAMGYFQRQTTLRWSDLSDPVENLWQVMNVRWNDRFFSAAFPFNLCGDENGDVYILGEADSADGVDIDSFFEFGIRAPSDGISKGMISRIYPFCEKIGGASHNLDIILKGTDHADGDLSVLSNLPYDLTHSDSINNFVSPFKATRFFAIRGEVSGQGVPFSLSGYDMEVRSAGKR